ncbi:hypothetical protein M6B38_318280 [Iris pallida]|uniref:Uncharacterized protein n=1 Tax=Iris pallida TaxID=29817 RepID=A0AAX6DWH9_IRIPA|nr:hypothetical protein M6B38_222120 [Iris pallida]KAJ6838605.1 hypothetical protein M6B38_318280 [Iris pallida]
MCPVACPDCVKPSLDSSCTTVLLCTIWIVSRRFIHFSKQLTVSVCQTCSRIQVCVRVQSCLCLAIVCVTMGMAWIWTGEACTKIGVSLIKHCLNAN